MNYINVGLYDRKLLHLIGCRYIDNGIALFLLNNNIEYAEITLYNRNVKLNNGYFIINPEMSLNLKKFLINKNIFKITNIINNYEIAMINKKVYDRLFKNIDS